MQQPLLVLSPCGTSLLTNQAPGPLRAYVGRNANARSESEVPEEERQALQGLIATARAKLLSPDVSVTEARKLSAEINGIMGLYEGDPARASTRDMHLLVSTDTWLGSETAALIEEWLGARGIGAQVMRQTDLQTGDLDSFHVALSELVVWCEQTLPGYHDAGYRIVFNLTGGFKSVQGFLQTLAMFYADEAVYIFETSGKLLRIPRLPITLDAASIAAAHLETFRRLSLRLPAPDLDSFPETLRFPGATMLSAWGELIWQRARPDLYKAQVYPSPCGNLRFGPGFEKSVAHLAPNRRCEVNGKIDDLCRYLETRQALGSLDFKELKGDPRPPSTHECDAWHDEDARRLYGHCDGGVFVLDALDRALH